ncbi:MAG: 50S ribosomal protein L18 [Kiritimatiellae bacterium]|nr:50S ribosomal protein L18 [Kiritimatiellia bacterium]
MKPRTRAEYRQRRHRRIRRRVRGSAQRPRMCVHFSLRHAQVQFVDDDAGRTLAAVSTYAGPLKEFAGRVTVEAARQIGRAAAEAARAVGISEVVFDRGGFRYGGRVKALADAAREGGLKF